MPLQVEILEQSFALVAPRGKELVHRFYGHLFADYPQVKPLFANVDVEQQKDKLLASIRLVVKNLRHPEVLVPALEGLGARHVAYGAQEAHYPAVGATLLKSLAEVAGNAWTKEVEQAWTEAYGEITRVMLTGTAVAAV